MKSTFSISIQLGKIFFLLIAIFLSFSGQQASALIPTLLETSVLTDLTVGASSGAKVIGSFSVINPNLTADTINQFTFENKTLLTAVATDISSASIYSDGGILGVIDGVDAVACAEATTSTVTNFVAGGSAITFSCSSPIAISGLGVNNYLAVITTSAGASDGRRVPH